jgi:hypothetical protein
MNTGRTPGIHIKTDPSQSAERRLKNSSFSAGYVTTDASLMVTVPPLRGSIFNMVQVDEMKLCTRIKSCLQKSSYSFRVFVINDFDVRKKFV